MTEYLDEPYFEGSRDKEIFNSVRCEFGGSRWYNEELGLDADMGLCTIFEDGVHVNVKEGEDTSSL